MRRQPEEKEIRTFFFFFFLLLLLLFQIFPFRFSRRSTTAAAKKGNIRQQRPFLFLLLLLVVVQWRLNERAGERTPFSPHCVSVCRLVLLCLAVVVTIRWIDYNVPFLYRLLLLSVALSPPIDDRLPIQERRRRIFSNGGGRGELACNSISVLSYRRILRRHGKYI